MNTTQKCIHCGSEVPIGKLICNACFQKSLDNSDLAIRLLEEHEPLCEYYSGVKDDLQKELTRSLSRKKRALMMKKHQSRLVTEWIVLLLVLIIVNIAVLFILMMNSYPGGIVIGSLVASLLLLIIMKFTRYTTLDMNLRTIPQLAYQIDLLDVPDNYIDHLQQQLNKISRILDAKVCT